MYGSLGTRSMVYQNEGGGLQFLPLWSASVGEDQWIYKPQWIDEMGNFQLFDNGLFGEYIPLTGSDQVQGSITPQENNTINLGQPDYRYANIYATTITSSVINSTLYDNTAANVGFAYFNDDYQLVGGGTIEDIPEFDTHTHYITQSIMVGQTPEGTTDSTDMFLRGNDGNDTKPEWSYVTPNYIRSNESLEALAGPGIIAIDSTSGYISGSWITSSISTESRVVGVKGNETTVSFFSIDEALDTTIITVPHGGTSRDYLTPHAVLIGSGSNPVNFAIPSSEGQVLISNGADYDPSFSNLYTLHAQIGYDEFYHYNPTSSDVTFTASALVHSHSANDIVSGQLAIGRIPLGTSYDTVAVGNHTHANFNLTIGSETYTYNGGYDVDVEISSTDIVSAIDVVPVQKGGTGITENTIGDLFVGKGGIETTVDLISVNNNNSGFPLVSNGAGEYPSYQYLNVPGGGTGITSYTKGDIIYAGSSDPTSLTTLSIPDGGQGFALIIGSDDVPIWSNSVLSSSYASYAVESSQSFYSIYSNATERLLTPFKLSIHGAVTAEAQYVDGQTDVQLNAYEVDANYLYGLAPIQVIPTGSYNTFTASTFSGSLLGTSSYAINAQTSSYTITAETASYAPDYIPLAGTDGTPGVTGDILPGSNNAINLGSDTKKYKDVYANNFYGTSSIVGHSLVYTSSTGTGSNNDAYNGSETKYVTINNGTIQVEAQDAANYSCTCSQANNDYSNHTIYLVVDNTAYTTATIDMSNVHTYIKVGDRITIKAVSLCPTYQYTVNFYTWDVVLNRKYENVTVTGSYGMDVILTCTGKGSGGTFVCEKVPVTFI